MAEQKTKPTGEDVGAYIKTLPSARKQEDGFFVLEMMNRITQMEPKMWGPSIIGYGNYHYKYESGHGGESPMIAFSPRKQRLVLYVLSNFPGQQQLLDKLGKYKTGKVCLYINKLQDVDIDVLEEIVQSAWKKVNEKKR